LMQIPAGLSRMLTKCRVSGLCFGGRDLVYDGFRKFHLV
jgi:hypothetical protein